MAAQTPPSTPEPGPRGLFSRTLGSLSFRLSFPVGLVIFAAVALAAYLNLGFQERRALERVSAEGEGFAETLKRAAFRDMPAGQPGHLYQIIHDLADQPGVHRVRIYNAAGVIGFSTHSGEAGQSVDMSAEACLACHTGPLPLAHLPRTDRSRVFRGPHGRRYLGTILPLYNRPACSEAPCHAHDPGKKVLGVLDVQLGLAGMDAQLAQERRWTLGFAALLFLAVSTIIGCSVILTVNRAVRRLRTQVAKVAAGDLFTVAAVEAPAELGQLAESINLMAQAVARRTEAQRGRYRRFLEDSPDAILVLDQEGRVILANPEAGRVLGRPETTLAGRPLWELVGREDRQEVLRSVEEALGPHRVCSLLRLTLVGEDGRTRLLEGRFRGIELAEGEAGVVGNFLDVTERGNLEAQLVKQAAAAAVGRTVAGLAPYLRNLVHGSGNAAYIVDEGLAAGDQDLIRRGWRMVVQSLHRVGRVTNDLLFYADYRLERPVAVDLSQVLTAAARQAGPRAERDGVTLEIAAEPASCRATGDPEGLVRAVSNLVVNALDALAGGSPPPGGGRVTLACRRDPAGHWVLAVADNGPGLDPGAGGQILTGLYTTKGAGGTGMGLLLCQKVAEEHGGFLAYADQPGPGAEFRLVWPDRPRAAEAAPAPPAA